MLIAKIYEDNALGKLSDKRYTMLYNQYEGEQEQLQSEIDSYKTENPYMWREVRLPLSSPNPNTWGIDSFESLAKFTADKEQKYQQLETVHLSKGQKLNRLKELSKMYTLYAPIQATYKESQSLKGLAKMRYDKEQTKTATELAYAEVISYNKKNLEREIQNESQQHNRQIERRTKTQPNQDKKRNDVEL